MAAHLGKDAPPTLDEERVCEQNDRRRQRNETPTRMNRARGVPDAGQLSAKCPQRGGNEPDGQAPAKDPQEGARNGRSGETKTVLVTAKPDLVELPAPLK